MNKKGFSKLLKEATKEFNTEKKERIKDLLKERMKEYEMATATVKRLEKEFKRIEKEGIDNDSLLLDYDE